MKKIALMMVKNEDWILEATIPQLKKFVDEILVLDTGSTDKTKEILTRCDVEVRKGDYDLRHNNNYSAWRQQLLNWARERSATHLIWLDADEAFTTNFLICFDEWLQKLQPGQKLILDWLCLWKSPYQMRIDNCVWKEIPKDFVFCDDGFSMFSGTKLHEGRTPGVNDEKSNIRVPREFGAVMHYQFAAFDRFQMKQAFQRMREFSISIENGAKNNDSLALGINMKYGICMDDQKALSEDMPKSWYEGINGLEKIKDALPGWYSPAIIEFFDRKGIKFFEPLQIWHIKELCDEFVKRVGKKPKSMIKLSLFLKIKNKLKTLIYKGKK